MGIVVHLQELQTILAIMCGTFFTLSGFFFNLLKNEMANDDDCEDDALPSFDNPAFGLEAHSEAGGGGSVRWLRFTFGVHLDIVDRCLVSRRPRCASLVFSFNTLITVGSHVGPCPLGRDAVSLNAAPLLHGMRWLRLVFQDGGGSAGAEMQKRLEVLARYREVKASAHAAVNEAYM